MARARSSGSCSPSRRSTGEGTPNPCPRRRPVLTGSRAASTRTPANAGVRATWARCCCGSVAMPRARRASERQALEGQVRTLDVAALAGGTGLVVRGPEPGRAPDPHDRGGGCAAGGYGGGAAEGRRRFERAEHLALHGAHAAEACGPGKDIGGRRRAGRQPNSATPRARSWTTGRSRIPIRSSTPASSTSSASSRCRRWKARCRSRARGSG